MPERISKATFDRIAFLLEDSERSYQQIGDSLGVHTTTVSAIAHGRHFYQADDEEQLRRQGGRAPSQLRQEAAYVPTPAEIAEACERIHAERRRAASEDEIDGWMPPVYSELNLMSV